MHHRHYQRFAEPNRFQQRKVMTTSRSLLISGLLSVGLMSVSASAKASLTPACKAAGSYVEFLTNGETDRIGALFAAETDYTGPTGAKLHKPVEIADAYRALLAKSDRKAKYRTTGLHPVGGGRCLLEFDRFDSTTGSFVPWAIDDFQVDRSGRVSRFLPYLQSAQVKRMYDIINGGKAAQ